MIKISRENVGEKILKFFFPFYCTSIFCLSLLNPKPSLALFPQSIHLLSSHLDCPVLVTAAWPGISITKLQHTEEQSVLTLDRFLPIPGESFFTFPNEFSGAVKRSTRCSYWEKKKNQYSAYLLVEILLSKTALIRSHQSRSSRFSPNPYFFKMLFSTYQTHLFFRQLSWKFAGSPQNARAFSGPDCGQFNILPKTKGQGHYLSCIALRGVEAVDVKWSL